MCWCVVPNEKKNVNQMENTNNVEHLDLGKKMFYTYD